MNRLELISEALATQDPTRLFGLFEKALALALSDYNEHRAALASELAAKLADQVKRQTEMINNLEKHCGASKLNE